MSRCQDTGFSLVELKISGFLLSLFPLTKGDIFSISSQRSEGCVSLRQACSKHRNRFITCEAVEITWRMRLLLYKIPNAVL